MKPPSTLWRERLWANLSARSVVSLLFQYMVHVLQVHRTIKRIGTGATVSLCLLTHSGNISINANKIILP